MKRLICSLLISLLCFTVFAACGDASSNTTETPSGENSSARYSDSIPQPGRGYTYIECNSNFETWNPTMGHISFAKEATADCDIYMPTPVEVWVNETQYVPLSYLWNRMDTQFTSGWKIQLNKLYRVDMGGYAHIYSDDCKNPSVIFTHDVSFGDVALYFRPDIAEKGIAAFSFGEFDISKNDSPYSDEEIRDFWNVHTGTGEYQFFTGEWTDGSLSDMKSYCVMLEHKENPALAYQLRFCVYEDILIIENVTLNATVYVNQAELRP